jgi:hypothetical protein
MIEVMARKLGSPKHAEERGPEQKGKDECADYGRTQVDLLDHERAGCDGME